jgi:hypothetical protein
MPATVSRTSRPRFGAQAVGHGSAADAVAKSPHRSTARLPQRGRLVRSQPAQLLFDWEAESRGVERPQLVERPQPAERPQTPVRSAVQHPERSVAGRAVPSADKLSSDPPLLGGLLVSVLARYGIDPAPVIEAMQQRERSLQRL